MKRFYEHVHTAETPKGWRILLDGKPVLTPNRSSLLAPSEILAEKIVREWDAQKEEINPQTMPLTQILSTKIDRISHERQSMTELLMKYLDTDLLCYRTDHPPELRAQQIESWDPWLLWYEKQFGTPLQSTETLVALKQPQQAHETTRSHIESLDDDLFVILQLVVPLSGSLILGLALINAAATAQQIFDASHIEEHFKAALYNEKKYGQDPLQEQKDQTAKRDLTAAEEYLRCLTVSPFSKHQDVCHDSST